MVGPTPTTSFADVDLDLALIDVGAEFGRIHRRAFPDPLGFGKNATRFSDPRRRVPDARFGVLYLGSSLKVCFVETILRDYRDGLVGDVDIAESEIDDRLFSTVRVKAQLRLLDLRDDGPLRMGVPSDVVRGRTQSLARKWSLAFHRHPAAVDGVIYPSRLNTEVNLAIYDRAVARLEPVRTADLRRATGIGQVLDTFSVALF